MRVRTNATILMLTFAALAAPALAQTGDDPANGAGGTAPAGSESSGASTDTSRTGGAEYGASTETSSATSPSTPIVDGIRAKILPDGTAAAPSMAPAAVQRAVWAANEIVGKPYIYGGGHKPGFKDRGYDCSGTISYALHGGRMLKSPLDSSSFMNWGAKGEGEWITVYTNPGHAYVVIAGLRLDTSAAGDPSGAKGPRWRPALRDTDGFRARHPVGY